jgi:pectinesterase
MRLIHILSIFIVTITTTLVSAQNQETSEPDSYLTKSWKEVATQMPDIWYGTDEAKAVAENVLLCQKDIGGWAKNKPYHHTLSEAEKATFEEEKAEVGATFDNGATITELVFLAKIYSHIKDIRYKQAFEKGLDYIFVSQYENGGWPQFYPFRTGKSVAYASHITYNDYAMVNIMQFLKDIAEEKEDYLSLQLNTETKAKSKKAFEKGVTCILKTQIMVDGKPTVWCAQHDEVTLAPANARKFELASFSGAESVGILSLLMEIQNPTTNIIKSVEGAVQWFESHKIEGIKLEKENDKDGKPNQIVVEDKTASPVWARFYDLETGKPFFCDRDGIKKNSIAEIGYERRNGYAWYTDSPAKLLQKYPKWKKKWNVK